MLLFLMPLFYTIIFCGLGGGAFYFYTQLFCFTLNLIFIHHTTFLYLLFSTPASIHMCNSIHVIRVFLIHHEYDTCRSSPDCRIPPKGGIYPIQTPGWTGHHRIPSLHTEGGRVSSQDRDNDEYQSCNCTFEVCCRRWLKPLSRYHPPPPPPPS